MPTPKVCLEILLPEGRFIDKNVIDYFLLVEEMLASFFLSLIFSSGSRFSGCYLVENSMKGVQ